MPNNNIKQFLNSNNIKLFYRIFDCQGDSNHKIICISYTPPQLASQTVDSLRTYIRAYFKEISQVALPIEIDSKINLKSELPSGTFVLQRVQQSAFTALKSALKSADLAASELSPQGDQDTEINTVPKTASKIRKKKFKPTIRPMDEPAAAGSAKTSSKSSVSAGSAGCSVANSQDNEHTSNLLSYQHQIQSMTKGITLKYRIFSDINPPVVGLFSERGFGKNKRSLAEYTSCYFTGSGIQNQTCSTLPSQIEPQDSANWICLKIEDKNNLSDAIAVLTDFVPFAAEEYPATVVGQPQTKSRTQSPNKNGKIENPPARGGTPGGSDLEDKISAQIGNAKLTYIKKDPGQGEEIGYYICSSDCTGAHQFKNRHNKKELVALLLDYWKNVHKVTVDEGTANGDINESIHLSPFAGVFLELAVNRSESQKFEQLLKSFPTGAEERSQNHRKIQTKNKMNVQNQAAHDLHSHRKSEMTILDPPPEYQVSAAQLGREINALNKNVYYQLLAPENSTIPLLLCSARLAGTSIRSRQKSLGRFLLINRLGAFLNHNFGYVSLEIIEKNYQKYNVPGAFFLHLIPSRCKTQLEKMLKDMNLPSEAPGTPVNRAHRHY